MGRCRVVLPETARLDISDGDWLDVKKTLTYGDRQKMMGALVKELRADGRMTPDLEMVGTSQILAYLVDWSLVDPRGKQIAIDTEARKLAAINSLDEDTVKEITAAIDAHIEAMEAEQDTAKKRKDGENASSATSSSAESSTGPMTT